MYPVPGPGGTPSQVWGGSTPFQVWGVPCPRSGGVLHPRSGGIPRPGGGVCHPRSGGYHVLAPEWLPHQDLFGGGGTPGTPQSRPGIGYPPSRPGMGYPPFQTLDGVPPGQTWDGVPPSPKTWDRVSPPASVDRHTDWCQNITLPRTTYAGGN